MYHTVPMGSTRKKLDSLEKIEATVAAEFERKRKKRRTYPEGGKTRIARDVRARKRKPPPVPDKPLKEVIEMDPDDPAFKHPDGRKRTYEGKDPKELPWKKATRAVAQKDVNKKRAKARKSEAVVIKAVEELDYTKKSAGKGENKEVFVEDRLIAEGVLSLDDWDDEELARGYRRDRRGRFGPPPKYIPQEVQQEAFRRLVKRGEKQIKSSYVSAVQQLTWLAQNADSEKVRLEAVKEIMDRVVGKVPEHLRVAPDAPWQGMLADSLVPLSDVPPIDVEAYPSGGSVAALPSGPQVAAPEVDPDTGADAPEPPQPKPRKPRPNSRKKAK